MTRTLTAEDLLAGATATHEVEVPPALVGDGVGGSVVLRPLTLKGVQTIARAAKGDGSLTSLFMIQQALVEPSLSVDEISALPAGLAQYLLARVNEVSGLTIEEEELEAAVRSPFARACTVLAREFGWSAAECSELTVGQVLMYLEMIGREDEAGRLRQGGSAA